MHDAVNIVIECNRDEEFNYIDTKTNDKYKDLQSIGRSKLVLFRKINTNRHNDSYYVIGSSHIYIHVRSSAC